MKYGYVTGLDKQVSRLVQGTASVTGLEDPLVFELYDAVFAQGGNTFDTAHGYGKGESERKLGRWIKANNNRDQVVIITKGAHPYDGRIRVTPEDITSDINESLERLQVDHVDLYLLHRDNPDLPVGPIVEVLNEHYKAGKMKAFGGSNWTIPRILEANAYAAEHSLTPFVMSSPNFSLADQVKEPWPDCLTISGPGQADARAHYHATQMPLFTWSSLAGGFFSGRFRRDNLEQFTEYFDQVCVNAYCYEDNFKRLERVEQLAQEKGVTSMQIAMAYVMHQPLNIFALVGCRSGEEFAQNVAAMELPLSQDEMDWLDLQK